MSLPLNVGSMARTGSLTFALALLCGHTDAARMRSSAVSWSTIRPRLASAQHAHAGGALPQQTGILRRIVNLLGNGGDKCSNSILGERRH